MRHTLRLRAVLPLTCLLLAGCEGFGSFIDDTHTFTANANRPPAEGPNQKRIVGEQVDLPPLQSEPGNMWPSTPPPSKTLYDLLQADQPSVVDGPTSVPSTPPPRGSSAMPLPFNPAATQPRIDPVAPSRTPAPPVVPPPVNLTPSAPPVSRVLTTPMGPATTSIGANGIETYTLPNGQTGTVIQNGNGTSTMIGSDGRMITVPNSR